MNNRMTNHIFYHSIDLDGKCSGAIAYRALKGEAVLHPINYGDAFPWDVIKPEDTVYMLDYALQPYDLMARLEKACKRFVWIDHHISAIDEVLPLLTKAVEGFQDSFFAACELTYMFFYEDEVAPMVQLLGRYDIWDHENPIVLPFQYGMRSLFNEPTVIVDNQEILNPIWNKVIGLTLDSEAGMRFVKRCTDRGTAIIDYTRVSGAGIAKQLCFEASLMLHGKPYNAIVMNRPFVGSKGFDGFYNADSHDLMMTFHMMPDGRWTVNLYTTRDDVDCSKICSDYGGGGHVKAGGFQVSRGKLNEILGLSSGYKQE